mgnify:FL=1
MSNLWPHQQTALQFLNPLAGACLEAGLGSGKTRVALELARGYDQLLVLCPKSVAGQWEQQIALWRPDLQYVNLTYGPVRDRARRAKFGRSHVKTAVLLNYDVLPQVAHFLAAFLTENTLVVADECHFLKRPSGRRSRAAASIGSRSNRLAMSGTPLSHSPLDAWAIFRFVDPRVFGPSYTAFKHRYTAPCGWGEHQGVDAGYGGGLRPYKFVNLDDLRERMYKVTYQCDGAPKVPVVDAVRTVDLELDVMRFYRRLDRDLVATLNDVTVSASNVLAKVMRLQQVTGGAVPEEAGADPQPVSKAKERELEAWLSELPAEEPVVIWCRFLADLSASHRAAANLGRESLELSGRKNELAQWQAGEAPILVAQVQAGGVGIALHRAHYACYYSLTRSLTDYEQSRGRLVRPGQQSPFVHFTHLVAANTIDEEIYEAFSKREDLLELIYRRRTKTGGQYDG